MNIIKELENKKNEATHIVDRTSKSIEQFENPMKNISPIIKTETKNTIKGGTKKQTKYRCSTKRVRFAL